MAYAQEKQDVTRDQVIENLEQLRKYEGLPRMGRLSDELTLLAVARKVSLQVPRAVMVFVAFHEVVNLVL